MLLHFRCLLSLWPIFRTELDGDRVYACALVSWGVVTLVLEQVPEVPPARRARDFNPLHSERPVRMLRDSARDGVEEAARRAKERGREQGGGGEGGQLATPQWQRGKYRGRSSRGPAAARFELCVCLVERSVTARAVVHTLQGEGEGGGAARVSEEVALRRTRRREARGH